MLIYNKVSDGIQDEGTRFLSGSPSHSYIGRKDWGQRSPLAIDHANYCSHVFGLYFKAASLIKGMCAL